MIIYPSMDLRAGKCVRLKQGDFSKQTTYHDNPVVVATHFAEQNAQYLHVVDLDGAKQARISQLDLIASIAKVFTGTVQVGGGVRSLDDVLRLLDMGVSRVVIGSLAVKHPEVVKEWLSKIGEEKLVLALDFKVAAKSGIPLLATHGWQSETHYSLWDFLGDFSPTLHALCTDIDLDGMQKGPNMEIYTELIRRFPGVRLQASGGVKDLEDLRSLRALGVSGCIIGKALYEGCFTLAEALCC